MREDMGLYRGKTTPKPVGHEFNEVWVYGDLLRSGDKCYIHPLANAFRVDHELTKLVVVHEVEPDTLGRDTGLTDKNGKRIFEGDIVKYTFDSPDDPTATENGLKVRIGRIFWSEWRAAFAVTGGKNGGSELNQDVAVYVRGRGIYQYVRGANTVEIIGNIHENPELLDGEET